MATIVACEWAGAVMEKVNGAFGRSDAVKTLKNAEKVEWGLTDQQTNHLTDQPTDKAGYRVA